MAAERTGAVAARRAGTHRGKDAWTGPAFPPAIVPPSDPALGLAGWVLLAMDDRIILRTAEGRTASGQVDLVADDASVFWVWLDGGGGRMAVHKGDECEVWKTG